MTLAQFNYDRLLRGVRDKVKAQDSQLVLRPDDLDLNNFTSDIDENQLNELFVEIFKGRFTHLDFSHRNLSAHLTKIIVQKIVEHYGIHDEKIHPDLTHLYLGGNDLRECSEMLEAFVKDPKCTLHTLDIAGKMNSALFLQAMTQNTSIQALHVTLYDHPHLMGDLIQAFQAIAEKHPALKTLHLNCDRTPNEILIDALEILKSNRTIQALHLVFVGSTYDDSDQALADLLQMRPDIQSLTFEVKPVSNELLHVFCMYKTLETIVTSRTLKHLAFKDCRSSQYSMMMHEEKIDSSIESFSYEGDAPLDPRFLYVLDDFPLKSLSLKKTGLNADQHAFHLLSLIATHQNTLEELNLSGNFLYMSNGKQTDRFLTDLSIALSGCSHLVSVDLSGMQFSLAEGYKFIMRLRAQNPLLQTIKIDLIHPYFQHARKYFEDDIIQQANFLLKETALRHGKRGCDETFLLSIAKNNQARYGKFFIQNRFDPKNLKFVNDYVAGEWPEIQKFYESRIKAIYCEIQHQVDYHHGPYKNYALYHEDFQWTEDRWRLYQMLVSKDYVNFHQQWLALRSSEPVGSRMTMMFDWVDEVLCCYVKAMRQHGIMFERAREGIAGSSLQLVIHERTMDAIESQRHRMERRAAEVSQVDEIEDETLSGIHTVRLSP